MYKNDRIDFRINTSLKTYIQKWAKSMGVSLAEWITHLIEKELLKNENNK